MNADIENLLEPVTRGDPESCLKRTSKSTDKLANELNKDKPRASSKTIARRLQELGYSFQSNKKTKEGIILNQIRFSEFLIQKFMVYFLLNFI